MTTQNQYLHHIRLLANDPDTFERPLPTSLRYLQPTLSRLWRWNNVLEACPGSEHAYQGVCDVVNRYIKFDDLDYDDRRVERARLIRLAQNCEHLEHVYQIILNEPFA